MGIFDLTWPNSGDVDQNPLKSQMPHICPDVPRLVDALLRTLKFIEFSTSHMQFDFWPGSKAYWMTIAIGVQLHDLIIQPTDSEKEQCRSRKQKWKNKPIAMLDSGPCDWLFLLLLFPLWRSSFFTGWYHERRSRKWNRREMILWSDCDSVELVTPYMTPNFDFYSIVSDSDIDRR